MEILDIYRQSQTYRVVSQDIKSSMLNHSYLINSKDEYLIKAFATLMAKEIFCVEENSPCDHCVNCNKVTHSNMVDLIIYPKNDKNLMVDDINEIVSDCFIKPMDASFKVYILNHFDECTIQAQNKLLKTLEEPPANVIFILTCVNIDAVLPTIASRSKKISEPALPADTIEKYLLSRSVSNARLVSNMSDGSLTIANKLSENPTSVEIVKIVFDVLKNLRSSTDVLKFSSKILSLKKDFNFFIDTMISAFRDISVYRVTDNLIFVDNKADYEVLTKIYNIEMTDKIISKLSEIPNKLSFNCNMTGVVDHMLLDILEVKFLCQK